jgi:hypothetical protein
MTFHLGLGRNPPTRIHEDPIFWPHRMRLPSVSEPGPFSRAASIPARNMSEVWLGALDAFVYRTFASYNLKLMQLLSDGSQRMITMLVGTGQGRRGASTLLSGARKIIVRQPCRNEPAAAVALALQGFPWLGRRLPMLSARVEARRDAGSPTQVHSQAPPVARPNWPRRTSSHWPRLPRTCRLGKPLPDRRLLSRAVAYASRSVEVEVGASKGLGAPAEPSCIDSGESRWRNLLPTLATKSAEGGHVLVGIARA